MSPISAALRDSEARLAAEADALARLNESSSRLWRMRNLREGLEEMLAATIELLGADMGNVQMLNADRSALVIAAQRGFEQDFLDFFREVSTEDDSACGRALRSGERILVEDVETDAPYAPLRSVARAAGYRAVQSTPLIGREGAPLGMLSTHWRLVHQPSEQDLRRLDLYARQAADFIERCRTDEALRESEESLRLAMRVSRMFAWTWDLRTGAVQQSDGGAEIIGLQAPKHESEGWKAVHPDDVATLRAALDRAVTEHLEFAADYRWIRPDTGQLIWMHARGKIEYDDAGKPLRMLGTSTDITERKQAEAHAELLLREVNHRSKNMLAVVQAVARQTAEDEYSRKFAQQFSERLAGLSSCQDLLVKDDWRGVDVGELIHSQLSHFHDLMRNRIRLDGPPVRLLPAAAQTIGMAVHELATNAGKYGALSNNEGSVNVRWNISANGSAPRYHMSWRERGGPTVAKPNRLGFGHTVMVDMVQHALDADVALDHAPEGIAWQISAPAAAVLHAAKS